MENNVTTNVSFSIATGVGMMLERCTKSYKTQFRFYCSFKGIQRAKIIQVTPMLSRVPSVTDSKYRSSKMIGREFTSPSRSAHSTGRGGKDRK